MDSNTLDIMDLITTIADERFADEYKTTLYINNLDITFIKKGNGKSRTLNVDCEKGQAFIEIKNNSNLVLVTEDDAFKQFDMALVSNIKINRIEYTNSDIVGGA